MEKKVKAIDKDNNEVKINSWDQNRLEIYGYDLDSIREFIISAKERGYDKLIKRMGNLRYENIQLKMRIKELEK